MVVNQMFLFVGMTGFEPATTRPRLHVYKAEKYDYQQLMGVSLLVV